MEIARRLFMVVALSALITPICFAEGGYSYTDRLDRLLSDYLISLGKRDIKRLVELDIEISEVVERARVEVPGEKHEKIWRNEYEIMGLEIGHYSDRLEYYGLLLGQVHQINPNSPYRESSLLSTLDAYSMDVPDVDKAKEYLREYPNGQYAPKVHAVLGTFYADLFKAIREVQFGGCGAECGRTCFDRYINGDPYEEQAEAARALAEYHLRAATISGKYRNSPWHMEELDAVVKHQANVGRWSWCTD